MVYEGRECKLNQNFWWTHSMFRRKKEECQQVRPETLNFIKDHPMHEEEYLTLEDLQAFVKDVENDPMLSPTIKEGVKVLFDRLERFYRGNGYKPGPFD